MDCSALSLRDQTLVLLISKMGFGVFVSTMARSGPSGIDSVSVRGGQCQFNIYAHFKAFPERFSHVLDNPVVRNTSGERER